MEGRSAVDSVKKSFVELPENVKALWAVWVPAQLLNFSVVPAHLRIPFGELGSSGAGREPRDARGTR